MTAPFLTGLDASVTYSETAVNSAPQLLDANVTFTDPDNDFNPGTLTLSGLLAEDTVSIRNEGAGAGQIGFAAGVVSFGGAAIGTAAGGAGGTLTVTFNASATSAAIDALIQNLTYANASNAPTASRTLTINVQDASGASLANSLNFTEATGAANPLNGYDLGTYSAPTLGDLDGDGDLDIIAGEYNGNLFTLTNTGGSAAPAFAAPAQIGSLDVGGYSAPTLGDLDGDGDLDLIVGEKYNQIFRIDNTGTSAAASFPSSTLVGNNVPGIYVAPALGDIDGDGDLDIVSGSGTGFLYTVTNTGMAASPVFGAGVQFGPDLGRCSKAALGDIDGDGDLDIVAGIAGGTNPDDGKFFLYTNNGTAAVPNFGTPALIGTLDVGSYSAPVLGDIDGDGDLDIISGAADGTFHTFINNASTRQIAVNVTPVDDPGVANDDAFTTNEAAAIGAGLNVFNNNGAGVDSDPDSALTVIAVGGVAASVGMQITLASGALLTLDANGTFSYDPNGAFDATPAPGSGASNTPATDTFSYTVTGGDTATVTITVTGIDSGDSLLGTVGDDVMSGGILNDVIDGLAGNDQLSGGDGADTINGGDGADRIVMSLGGDVLDGGAGKDTLDFRGLAGSVTLDMGAGTYTLSPSLDTGTLTGVEQVIGSNGADTITGNVNNNIIQAAKGNDTVNGAGGNDFIAGNHGSDILTGGLGHDYFDYNALSESTTALRDTITDFKVSGSDKIDLSTLDANATIGGNQSFSFLTTLGAAFTAAGQVRFTQSGGNTFVDINTDANLATIEMQIQLTGLKTLVTADFVL